MLAVTFGVSAGVAILQLADAVLSGLPGHRVRLNPNQSRYDVINLGLNLVSAAQLIAWGALALYLLWRSGIRPSAIGLGRLRWPRDALSGLGLAALIGIPYSYVAPHHYVQTNIIGTVNVLEAVRETGVGRMVHVSTSETYGTAQFVPISEHHPVHAQSPYAATKAGADQLALSYARSFDTPVVVIRPFNTYGPRQSARAFIPTVITQALASDEVRLGAISPRRDLTYVADTVDGMVRAAFATGVEGLEINLGTGVSHSVGEVAERIVAAVNPAAIIVHDEDRDRPAQSEVLELQSDITRARELLGYDPLTTLDQGLASTIQYMRDNLARYRVGEYLV